MHELEPQPLAEPNPALEGSHKLFGVSPWPVLLERCQRVLQDCVVVVVYSMLLVQKVANDLINSGRGERLSHLVSVRILCGGRISKSEVEVMAARAET